MITTNQDTSQNVLSLKLSSVTPQVLREAVAQLYNGTILAVIVEDFYPVTCCNLAASIVDANTSKVGYEVEPTFLKTGETIFDTRGEETKVANYLQLAPAQRAYLQAKMLPLISPDKFLQLFWQDGWPAGAQLEEFRPGKFANFGVARQIYSGGGVEPHCDRTDEDLPGNKAANSHILRCPGNIYLRSPMESGGGTLQLWNLKPTPEEYSMLRDTDSPYALDRRKLGEPDVVIHPKVGSYVFFSGSTPHAVSPVVNGDRIAISGFVAFTNMNETARLYS